MRGGRTEKRKEKGENKGDREKTEKKRGGCEGEEETIRKRDIEIERLNHRGRLVVSLGWDYKRVIGYGC